jgi:hypothetical protein
MLSEIFEKDRIIRLAYKKLCNSIYYNQEVVTKIDGFLKQYAEYYNLSVSDIVNIYNEFTNNYLIDIRSFLKTGKYPLELGVNRSLSRVDYDIFLILSVVLTIHRHRIFNQLILSSQKSSSDIVLIGVGSGLEIEFLRGINNILAYDISISNFAKSNYPSVEFVEGYFNGTKKNISIVYAIELVEHLEDPISFLKMIYNSLMFEGKFFFTTATNVPQIDHLSNFTNIKDFELQLKEIGFLLQENIFIQHEYILSKLNANNNWFEVKK